MCANENVEKVCSFCVSDLHLITMLLPYLNKKISEKEKFITILEKDLVEQVNLVLSRLTLNNKDKKDLLNINWNCDKLRQEEVIKEEIAKLCSNTDKLSIIVNGSKKYIEEMNEFIEKVIEANDICQRIKIINCYDITALDDDIKEILKTHDVILNTSGEKAISEVFEGYDKQKGA